MHHRKSSVSCLTAWIELCRRVWLSPKCWQSMDIRTIDKPQVTTPAQTVRTDLPKVTAEPQYTTAATTTTKPAKQTEPAEIQTDANGFPANPEVNQTFVDSTGTEYIYNGIFGWIQGNDGTPPEW